MGLLDDAIREHLELKRRSGADAGEVQRLEKEALGPARREAQPPEDEGAEPAEGDDEPAAGEPDAYVPTPHDEDEEGGEGAGEHDELEETPEFLQETPEHDRLWFEQKPPRDFDF